MVIDYDAHKIHEALVIDGDLSKPIWEAARKSRRFVDMADGGPALYDTKMACLWSETHCYIGFWVEEPFLAAQLTERDATIFQENVVEMIIDGGDTYYELQVNALATVYEVFFIWRDAYTKGGRFDVPEFDLIDSHAYSFGGDFDRRPESFWDGTHPRGTRWAFRNWDFPGLEVGVQLDGTLNDHADVDEGWTVEIALPWSAMSWLADGRSLPPVPGDVWAMFFGRFQKSLIAGAEVQPHPAWVLKPHGKYDTHQPELFPRIRFVDVASETDDDPQLLGFIAGSAESQ